MLFATARPNAQYLALYRQADLFRYRSPTGTRRSATRCGPAVLVTVIGETFAGRVAASLLTAVGTPELIAPRVDAYVEQAIALARDPGRRAALRAYLEGPGHTSPLFDTTATTRSLEAAYLEMAAQHRAGTRRPFRVGTPAA